MISATGSSADPDDLEFVVLVDEQGKPIGQAEKVSSHHSETPLHLAFSCYVFDERGMFLATRRALGKQVWPGVWSNSVCGHPRPGETMTAAVRRRLAYELGMRVDDIALVLPAYRYRAPPFAGVVENEFCPVYVARAASPPLPNRTEVEEFEWVEWSKFTQSVEFDRQGAYSWWCKDQLLHLKDHPMLGVYRSPAG